ncbi:MAG: substrate-binding domain-containing protein [Actinomycetota bacterium]
MRLRSENRFGFRAGLAGIAVASSIALVLGSVSVATAADAKFVPLAKASCDLSSKTITYLSVLKAHPTLRLWEQGFLDEAKKLGFKKATIAAPDEPDWTKAVALGEGVLANGTDGLVLGFVDPAEKDLIAKFGAKKIPAVIGHVQVKPNEYPGVIAYAAFDPKIWGAAAAKAIGKAINGKGTVAITESSFNVQEDAVAAAFKKQMKASYPKVKVLAPAEEGTDPPKAIAKAVAILLAHPDVVGALSTTGAGPVTWAGAADQTGRKVAAIGPDATRPNLDAVRDGKILGIAAQPGYEEHQMAVDIVAQAICGKKPAVFAHNLPAPIVLKAGLKPYYKVVDAIDARVKAGG